MHRRSLVIAASLGVLVASAARAQVPTREHAPARTSLLCFETPRPPVLVHAEAPVYPQAALDGFVEGHASSTCTVDREGRARDCETVVAPEGLEQAFLDAVAKYRFQPATACGTPVSARYDVSYEFELPPEVRARGAVPQAVGRFGHSRTAGTTPPVFLGGRKPQYTAKAIAARSEGLAVVKCIITVEGTVERCRVLQSVPHMDAEILSALATHRYKPVTYQGKPIAVDYTFNIRLSLPR